MNVKRKTVKIKSLTSENQKLITENERLQQKVEQADADIEEFIQEFENKNKKITEENEILKSSRVQLLSLIQKQTTENRKLLKQHCPDWDSEIVDVEDERDF